MRKIAIRVFVAMVCLAGASGYPLLAGQSAGAKETVSWPEITAEASPSTYWWWMGNAVNKEDLTCLLEEYREVGLGGVKIDPIYGARGHEDKFIEYLSPEWVAMLDHVDDVTDRLGMTVDISTSTGWNMGGPWVKERHAGKRVILRTYTVEEGSRLEDRVQYIQKATSDVKRLRLQRPISQNSGLHKQRNLHVRFRRKLPLLTLMAYSETGKKLDLTDRVSDDGTLRWTAPEGTWKLYAVFQGEAGKFVERPAPGGAGWMIDYFSADALKAHLQKYERAFAGYDTSEMFRAFHDDSYEGGAVNWTGGFFEDFEKMQGYDLREHLPALFSNRPDEEAARVKSDYRETISHLVTDEHTAPWAKWAHQLGNSTINQSAFGLPAHPLDVFGVSDIPESTGGNQSRVLTDKLASSAAHVTGKQEVSAETGTWLDQHFHVSLAELKDKIDMRILGGINRIAYHSTAYSPPDAQWPGWLYYASTQIVPANPIWRDFPALNRYTSAICSFMQSGRPDNEILLYYPIYDTWYNPKGLLFRLGSVGTSFGKASQPGEMRAAAIRMRASGYTFDYISDRQIYRTRCEKGKLVTEGGDAYLTLVVPRARFMPLKTLKKLKSLVGKGATVIFQGGLPEDVPGLERLDERRDALEDTLEEMKPAIRARQSGSDATSEGKLASGGLLVGEDVETLLSLAGVDRERMTQQGLQFVRRSHSAGHLYFVKNVSDHKVEGWVPLAVPARSVALFDCMRHRAGLASIRRSVEGETAVYLRLDPGETRILRTFRGRREGRAWQYIRPREKERHRIDGTWQIDFVSGGPSLPDSIRTEELVSWTELGGAATRRFSGTAAYSITFEKPSVEAGEWLLDLGQVCESARVILNGDHIATFISPPFRVRIGDALQEGTNRLRIEVTNLGANRLRHLDRQETKWRIFYNINFSLRKGRPADWPVLKSGLFGPVELVPAELVGN